MPPSRYRYLPVFEARLALVLTRARHRNLWYREGLAEDVGTTFVTYWDELPPVPDRAGWRRLVVTAEPPFAVPGVVLIDASLSADGHVIEIRGIDYVSLEGVTHRSP